MKQNYTRFNGLRGLAMFAFLTLVGIPSSFAQTTYTFTNASATGDLGPSQVQVDAAYTATTLAGDVTVIGQGMQEWTVPATGNYSISAAGASGGFTPTAIGGQGREITVDVILTAGDVIRITVGQEGGRAEFSTPGYSGGGGGGTFIINQTTGNPILIVGGGGGAGEGNANYVATLNGVDASDYNVEDGTDGTGYAGSWSQIGIGGVAGAGGTTFSGGAGGGGYTGDGQLGTYGGNIGNSYTNGAAGGTNRVLSGTFTLDIPGGFGGGAGTGIHANYEANGGGAGGYSGGGGSNSRIGSGGGGGNFYTGVYVSNSLNTGNGVAVFTRLCVDSAPSAFTIDACATYTVPSGDETYVVSGVYNDTIPNVTGCDSVMTITVNVTTIDNSTSIAGFTITATESGSTYQWIDCNDNDAAIAGATNQDYTADANGDYAVIVTNNGCSDTSDCVTIAGVGIDATSDLGVNVYPNPTNGQVYISTVANNVTVSIYSVDGKLVVNSLMITESNQMIDLGNIESGIYFVEVSSETTKETIRLVVE